MAQTEEHVLAHQELVKQTVNAQEGATVNINVTVQVNQPPHAAGPRRRRPRASKHLVTLPRKIVDTHVYTLAVVPIDSSKAKRARQPSSTLHRYLSLMYD